MPEFQRLVDDYREALEPMRQRVVEAQQTGDWESLRQRTYQWAEKSARSAATQSAAYPKKQSREGD
jgi:hypothetical protein